MATKVTNGLDLSSQKIVNVADPTADQDAATKKYVDDKGARYKVTLFSSSGSWTVDANAQFVDVYCFSGGAGGNSGRWTSVSGTYYSGGLGGPGGFVNHARFAATIFSGSVTVTVGAGGAGGIAVTTTNTTVAGSYGGNSTFGGYLTSAGGSTIGGAGGTGGSPDGLVAATAGSKSRLVWNYADKIELSEALATWNTGGTAGVQAQPVGGAGGQPASVLSAAAYGNAGGGGGGAARLLSTATVLTGGKGGKGGLPSGGGGGGGSANRGATGTKGGDGGDGGDGAVVVVEWLK